MTGRITLIGAGELMAAMSRVHRAALAQLGAPPRPVFLDATAGFETNADAIVEKAVDYYGHYLQTGLRIANYRHREKATPAEIAAAVAEIRAANLIFAGPGSPTYAVKQWRDSPVWDAVLQAFDAGSDILFASAAAITLGRYTLPVYEIYKVGEDPFWTEGLDLLGRVGLNVAIVPHFDDASGGENYDSRFCYVGAQRFDVLQALLPADVTIVGIDAYTALSLDPKSETATVSGQGGVTIIGDGERSYHPSGSTLPFAAFHSAHRRLAPTVEPERHLGYEFSDAPSDPGGDPFDALIAHVESLQGLAEAERIELLARVQGLRGDGNDSAPADNATLLDLLLELRRGLREAKRFDLADRARDVLNEIGYEVADTPEGSTWSRR
jgi:hypothetical protein